MPGDRRAPRVGRRRARHAADPDRPLRRRRVRADPARPRLRRRRRRAQLGADRGRARGAAVAAQGDVPGAQEPGQPPPRGRLHVRAVALRVHEHVQRGGVARAVRALPRPGVGRRSSGTTCSPTSSPATRTTWVNYKNDDRAPLLFVSGSEDHLMPPSVQRSNAKHYKAEHGHRGQGVRGLRAPAARAGGLGGDRRLRARRGRSSTRTRWAPRPVAQRRVTDVRLTHIGGPTTLIEVEGWRLLTDPTFDPPGRTYDFGWGSTSRKLAGPAIAAADLRADRRRAAHATTTTATTSTTPDARCSPRPASSSPPSRARSGSAAARAGSSRGRRPARGAGTGRRSRSPRRRAATARRSAARSSATSIGFALRWDGQEHGVLWISGDTVLYDGVREVADRLQVDIALLHLGGVQFPITGPLRYTHDRPRRGRAVRPDPPAHRDPDPLRGLEALPRGPRRRSSASSRRRPRTSAGASAGCRSARGRPRRPDRASPSRRRRAGAARSAGCRRGGSTRARAACRCAAARRSASARCRRRAWR